MRAVGYLRCSGKAQAESGLGLEAQQKSIEEASQRLGMTLVAVHVDAGVSGRKGLENRPALFDALQDLKRGDVLLVSKRCRLGRDVVEVGLIERQIKRRGARVLSAAGEGTEADDDDPTALFLRRILDAVNELEVAQTRARTRAALRAKKRRGERAGTIPYGFTVEEDGQTLIRDGYEQAVIAAVKDARKAGMSQWAIVADLKDKGYVSRVGKPLGRGQVRGILKGLKEAA